MKFMGGCGGRRVWGEGCGGRRVWGGGGYGGEEGVGGRRMWARKGDSLSSDIDDLSSLPFLTRTLSILHR